MELRNGWIACLRRGAPALALLAGAGGAGCALEGASAPGDELAASAPRYGEPAAGAGAVYAMTNAIGANEIVIYRRAADGTLTPAGSAPTGGGGSGIQLDAADSLGSQGSLVLDRQHRFLLAVNTETSAINADHDCHQGSISVFRVAADGALTSAGPPVPSGGLFPNSVAIHGSTVYVLNAGGPDQCAGAPGFEVYPNITGFTIAADGALARIHGGTRLINPGLGPAPDDCAPAGFGGGSPQFACGLNPPAFPRAPGQVGFSPDGDAVLVTVKATNSIHVFPLDDCGAPRAPVIARAAGGALPTYFGFSFDPRGHLLVSEPFGAAPVIPAGDASAVSSFRLRGDGSLAPISTSVANGQGTSCWIAVDPVTGAFAYTSNNLTSNLSAYAIAPDGGLSHMAGADTQLPGDGEAAAHPNDLAVAVGRAYDGAPVGLLYSLHAGSGQVGMFRIERDGALTPLGEVGGLPADAGAQGLAAF